ncbi:hypothetical protein GTA08_BOTSDO07334 [Botryosphaeria dothidea]|uniref:Uncharacterized protein n=1 Tax=Botryosphaeria dothidea TaxID=55169 RepID=A0A8H4IPT8_9PEZI|nr:hypothetical protein GTA08_BOTSDO11527 [Botryosphaeria dothidea]KAF4305100.1 hypothetical protein GTA08_BOTSDO07334 [Botryosphaeria dothidea]
MASYPPQPPEMGDNFTRVIHGDTYDFVSPTKHVGLAGRAVFISGASKGVGRAIARSCAAAGCTALALAANAGMESIRADVEAAAPEATRPALRILTFTLDVCDAVEVEAAAAQTQRAFGRLDVLVNSAGCMQKGALVAESDPHEWWRTLDVNLRGTYLVTRALLPLLLAGDGGLRTVVNLSSTGAHGLFPGGSAYQLSKLAVLKFTESVMADYAGRGVLCYAVHPGAVLTELALNIPERYHQILTDAPELAGDTVVFLAHTRREWLAGRFINCKWDMAEFLQGEREIVDGDKLKVRLIV